LERLQLAREKSLEVVDCKGEKLLVPAPPGVLQKEAGFA
jgi:hypothetical protein